VECGSASPDPIGVSYRLELAESKKSAVRLLRRRRTPRRSPHFQYARALVSGQASSGSAAATKDVQPSGPFYGYYYRLLGGGEKGARVSESTTAGIAFPACPARYRWTGVMTFIVGPDNAIYDKDLGPNTAKIAKAITGWEPDLSWYIAEATLTPGVTGTAVAGKRIATAEHEPGIPAPRQSGALKHQCDFK
jgi:hypothetical protein